MKFLPTNFVAKAFSAPPACMTYAAGAVSIPSLRLASDTRLWIPGNWSFDTRTALPLMWAIMSAWAMNRNNPMKNPYNSPTIVTTITSQAMSEKTNATAKSLFSDDVLSSTACAMIVSLSLYSYCQNQPHPALVYGSLIIKEVRLFVKDFGRDVSIADFRLR